MDKDTKPDDPKPEAPETPEMEEAEESAPVDLSALQGFDFGTNWSKSTLTSGGSRTSDRKPRHGDRRSRGDQADRKPFKPGSFRKPGWQKGDEQGSRSQRTYSGQGRRPMGRPDIPKKVIEASFYPEDNGFKALCKALKISSITYELFDIARTILEKEERFYMIIRPSETPSEEESKSASFYVVESNDLPFLSEEAAKQHALSDCLEHFFIAETTEVEAPSGSFSSIRKCGFTGELLGPPNFHRIKKIMADHHASKLSNMPFAKFESKIESVTEEEVIAEWLEKMKTQTIYTLKPEFGEPRVFEDGETARAFVKANLAEKLVRKTTSVRLDGTQMAKVKDNLLKANLEFIWERQKKFPLDTANLLRGRLRRQNFALYKKSSKGVSFVCAVKRKFREPGQAFSDLVQKLIEYVETNPNTKVRDLPEKILGFATHAPEGESGPELTEEQQTKLKAMTLDFQWLLKEGYIAEYSDGSIYSHPIAGPGQGVVPLKPGVRVATPSTKPESTEADQTKPTEKAEEKSTEPNVKEIISEKPEDEVAASEESGEKTETVSKGESESDAVEEEVESKEPSLSEAEETPESKTLESPDAEAVLEEDSGGEYSSLDDTNSDTVDKAHEKEVVSETKPVESVAIPKEAESEVSATVSEDVALESEEEKPPSSKDSEPELKKWAKS